VSVHASVCARKGKDAYKVTRRASDTANSWKTCKCFLLSSDEIMWGGFLKELLIKNTLAETLIKGI